MSNLGNAQDIGISNKGLYKKTPSKKFQPGDKIGEWTIIIRNKDYTYRAECSCGVVANVSRHALTRNMSKMCSNCAMKERRKMRQNKVNHFTGRYK